MTILSTPLNAACLTATLALTLFALGCRTTRPAVEPPPADRFPNHTMDEVRLALASAQPIAVAAYRAETALSLRSPAQSGSFSAEIRHRANDSLLISVSPGFGIVAVRALITPDSVFIHDRINKELAFGSVEAVGKFLPLPTDPSVMYQAMLGSLEPDSSVDWQLSSAGAYYRLADPAGRRAYTIDPQHWRVVRYEERDGAGGLVEERTFSEFERYTTAYLPRRLTFRRPADDTAAILYYRSITLNPPDLEFDFRIGSSVRRVPLL
jgi:hypothetical protein